MTLAARCGDADIIVELVKAGANLDLQNKVQNYISHLLPHERLDFNIQGLYLSNCACVTPLIDGLGQLIMATQTLNRLEILLPQLILI